VIIAESRNGIVLAEEVLTNARLPYQRRSGMKNMNKRYIDVKVDVPDEVREKLTAIAGVDVIEQSE
jgi:hypothetical protein